MILSMVIVSISGVIGILPEPTKYILSFPTGNPMNITVDPSPEKNYFLTIGDWGCAANDATGLKLQTGVAQLMQKFVKEQEENGMNLLFVGAVGDNFYEDGQTCQYWKDRWTDMYGFVATDYPWLTVWGNHDWGFNDPDALCPWGMQNGPKYIDPNTKIPYGANQIDADKGGCNPKNYYLPDFGYYYSIPELDFEWIAIDKNSDACPEGQNFKDCNNSQTIGCNYMKKIEAACDEMMAERANVSTATNFMLIQHYTAKEPQVLQAFKNARKQNSDEYIVWSAAGHQHGQECMNYNNGACDQIMTGGGGHGNAGLLKGFYYIGFDSNKKMIQPLAINDTRISCMNPCGQSITQDDIIQSMIYNCCNDPDERENCPADFDMETCV